jgi:hypothetical protein
MNKKADQVNDDNDAGAVAVLENDPAAAAAEDENNPSNAGGAEGTDDEASAAAADDEVVVVTIGEEAPPTEEDEQHASAPQWVRELRKTNREKDKRIRELESKLQQSAPEHNPVAKLGKKPTLEDHDYDSDKYEAALDKWFEDKRKADEQAAQAAAAVKKQEEAWKARLETYDKAKTTLRVKDFEDAEMTVQDVLSVTQQGIIVQGSENPALVVYALGKNPKKAKELASETDPVKFAFAVAKLETQLKVTNRKAPLRRPSTAVEAFLVRWTQPSIVCAQTLKRPATIRRSCSTSARRRQPKIDSTFLKGH